MRKYKTIYQDKHGIEKAEFQSDGSSLKINLRGTDFAGGCFEGLEGEIDYEKFDFVNYEGENETGELTNCKFQVEIPVKLCDNKNEILEILHAEIQLKKNGDGGVFLVLEINKDEISNTRKFGWFEDALIDIQKQLSDNLKLKTCLSCKFSHYSPFGNGMFGNLYCFRKVKEKTLEICDKCSLFEIWELAYQENKLFNVQETYDCPEYQLVEENNWVYKNWI